MENKINQITDILRRDDGISGAMHYTEQISWILFLKFLDDYEDNKSDEAELIGKNYSFIIEEKYRWSNWAIVKKENGDIDHKATQDGEDLLKFVNNELFKYLKSFKEESNDKKSIKYKIGAIFEFLDNRIANGHTLKEVIFHIDNMDFHSQSDLFQLSQVYEKLLKDMGSDGGNSGEFYTPRPVVKTIVDIVDPKPDETIYDPSAGSCGFLIDAYEHIKSNNDLSTKQLTFLQQDAFFGNEKTPLSYVMGVMNMILHGIESPNIIKENTLSTNIRNYEEKDRYDNILANPPFGGKEQDSIQANFPIKSNATELLFLQHIMKKLKLNGRCGIVIPEGVLFQTNKAFKDVKKELLENYNVHTILSLPSGVFLPYSGVKTNVVFFDKKGVTSQIYYYELTPPYKLTKNKPIQESHFEEFKAIWKDKTITKNSWIVDVKNIKEYDLSAKNPNNIKEKVYIDPKKLVKSIKDNNKSIDTLMDEINEILNSKDIK